MRMRFMLLIIASLFALSACDRTAVYSKYRDVSPRGWMRSDTLRFRHSHTAPAGTYTEAVCLRVGRDYPFSDVTLIVEQSTQTRRIQRTDTLHCVLADQGQWQGEAGVSYLQYRFSLADISLSPGDTLRLAVRHGMRHEPLHGIADVGIEINRR